MTGGKRSVIQQDRNIPGIIHAAVNKNRERTGSMTERAMEMASVAVHALEDRKGTDIKVIDISEVSVVADCFIIASGGNERQLNAMADSVEESLEKAGMPMRHKEGRGENKWILLDFHDVVIHIFDREMREYYDLERIWRDGKAVEIGGDQSA